MDEYMRRVTLLRENMRSRSVSYNWHDAQTSYIEAALARGDRRLGCVIEQVVKTGGRLDSWGEHFSFERWLAAFAVCGLDPDFYALRERGFDEILPWSVTSVGVGAEFLWRERCKSRENLTTPDCREECSACGASDLTGGVCNG
jgi:hypothetical protein